MKHIPRKRFGQHFLTDERVIHAIVNAIDPRPDDVLVEIGPGLGALTKPLLERIPHLHVVELDRDIIARLKKTWPPERLVIHEGDALKFDFGSLGHGIRVCGNLPYNISSPLLFHLKEYAWQISDMTFMLQKEVVDRMVATPSTPAYGRLSVMLQRRFHMEALFDVPPEAFDPPPKVESAIVRMIPKKTGEYAELDEQRFAEIVTAAFSQRRKTLRNTLGKLLGEEAFTAAGIDPGLRAENLAVGDFEKLTRINPRRVTSPPCLSG
ncbi:MAG: 16S rRNA (adenine(1518)-N(6)/adenine(1519)-N(6))-dimethyltransferase RsmA [Hydrogenophilaceae bacterium]|nr:16S rRNA (adenine(1518)-N(6)/adenine(1519)-N(6))-dimethyltransferase RsmA [Hydrogenophilaceae bacterium]